MTGDPSSKRAWVREPLLHFVLLGAAIFVADALLRDTDEDRVIVVDESIRSEIAQRAETNLGHTPSAEELQSAILSWTKQEVLYREGVLREFDVHDPGVRSRVASRMAQVLASSVVLEPPTEAELREYFALTPGRWADPARIDFTHVFVEGRDDASEARAQELLELLQAGASPTGLGDRFSGGRRYRGRTFEDLELSFGPEFTQGMDEERIDTWILRPSRVGFHVVRLDARSTQSSPTFEQAADRVRRDWEIEREDVALDAAEARLMEPWKIVSEP